MFQKEKTLFVLSVVSMVFGTIRVHGLHFIPGTWVTLFFAFWDFRIRQRFVVSVPAQ
jgi:hypothetical protein